MNLRDITERRPIFDRRERLHITQKLLDEIEETNMTVRKSMEHSTGSFNGYEISFDPGLRFRKLTLSDCIVHSIPEDISIDYDEIAFSNGTIVLSLPNTFDNSNVNISVQANTRLLLPPDFTFNYRVDFWTGPNMSNWNFIGDNLTFNGSLTIENGFSDFKYMPIHSFQPACLPANIKINRGLFIGTGPLLIPDTWDLADIPDGQGALAYGIFNNHEIVQFSTLEEANAITRDVIQRNM